MQHFMELVKELGAIDDAAPVGTFHFDPHAAPIFRDLYHRQAPGAFPLRRNTPMPTRSMAANIQPGENAARERRARSNLSLATLLWEQLDSIDQDELTCSERLLAAVGKLIVAKGRLDSPSTPIPDESQESLSDTTTWST